MRRFHGRPDARCPGCGALERHRALWLFIERELGSAALRGRMLHVAPEVVLERKLRSLDGLDYVAGDLSPQRSGVRRLDVTAIDFPNATFDFVIMNHVLEHVPDDGAALREIHRVLRSDGLAMMQHPMDESRVNTYEDASVILKADRRKHFGQEDHVRIYGQDLLTRMRDSGFTLERRQYSGELPADERTRYALAPAGQRDAGADIYLLRPVAAAPE